MDFFKEISDLLHIYIKGHFPEGLILLSQLLAKILLLLLVTLFYDILLRLVLKYIFLAFINLSHYKKLEHLYSSKVHYAIAHIFPWILAANLIEKIFYRHPKSYVFLERFTTLALLLSVGVLCFKVVKAIEEYYTASQNLYRITAIKAISSTFKILGYIIFGFLLFFVMLGINATAILSILSATTAIILLVFRDTILGFVTGIHVSTSKNLKVGDWIGVKKYDVEGTISEINLLTTKIVNFDKTISTIPTYDLLSTEIKNHQAILDGGSRRIKRSIFFNIKSFKFIDEVFYEKIKNINLISEYVDRKYTEILEERKTIQNQQVRINGRQLTNIGVFRNYVINYLTQNKHIDHHDVILVRQLEISPEGLPLEIYCFTNKAELLEYERIQADIFDHILTAAQEFGLEVMQFKNS